MIDREGLEISQKNVYDGVFSKVTYLQFTDCNSSIKRLLHRSFSEYVSKTSCLKKNILTKKSMVDQCFNKVEPAKPTTLSKNGAHLRPFCRSAVNSNVFTRKFLRGGFFSAGLELQV